MLSLRRATGADIEGIATVVREVWRQDILPDVCRAHIEDNTCGLWVATEEGEIAGFASAFLTAVADTRRWEIDLVAVRRASRGRGIGTRLIRRAYASGQRHDVCLTRALVRAENTPGQRAFQSAGFRRDPRLHALLLWPPAIGPDARSYAGPVTLLPVDTLTYRGLWVEHLTSLPAREQRRAVTAARSLIARQGRLNAGAVIPVDGEHLLAPDPRDQADKHGVYHWFTRVAKRET